MSEINKHLPGERIPSPSKELTVAIVEDDRRSCEALAFQLRTAGFHVISYDSAESFLGASAFDQFDCVVADICLPKMNGLQLIAELRRHAPFVSVIFITGHGDMSIGVQAMKNGALDCLEKPVDDDSLLRVVRRGASLSQSGRSEHVRRLELQKRACTLTPREREVFALITSGLLNKQVGARLGPTEHTIKTHRGRVMKKMGADSLADLVRMSEVLQVRDAMGEDLS